MAHKDNILFFIISILFFLATNHFDGFIQDCIPYTLQAVEWLRPGRFIDDPGFMFGSQDKFSIYTPIYGTFIRTLGVVSGAKALCFITHILVAASIALFFYKWANKFHLNIFRLPITLLFMALYAYGETRNDLWISIKSIEAFPVARTFSVAFGFTGLALLFDKRKWLSISFFLIGSLIHPLTAGWGIPLCFIYHFPRFTKPLLLISIFAPLTVFWGKEPFAAFPTEWADISFKMKDADKVILSMTIFCAFFYLLKKNISFPTILQKASTSLLTIFFIATFWQTSSIFLKHILLFQVQTFRVQWLCQSTAFFIFAYLTFRLVLQIKHNRKIPLWGKFSFVTGVFLWIDSPFIIILMSAYVISFLGKKTSYHKTFAIFYPIILCALTVFSIYRINFLSQQKIIELFIFESTFNQILFASIAAFACIATVFFKHLKFAAVFLLLTSTLSALYGQTILHHCNFATAFLLGAIIWIICNSESTKKRRNNTITFIILLSLLSPIIVFTYDHRTTEQKTNDNIMNQFLDAPPFPYIKERGRILFASEKYGFNLPRIAFLSGAYYDSEYDVSSIFFKELELETKHRMKKMISSDSKDGKRSISLKREELQKQIFFDLSQYKSLAKIFHHLCDEHEISYLISNKHIIQHIFDSLTVSNDIKIYLFKCQDTNHPLQL